MTDRTNGPHTLPLQGSTAHQRTWLLVLVFGIPVIVLVGLVGTTLQQAKPIVPVLLLAGFVLGVCAIAVVWIQRMLRRIAVKLDGTALDVDTGIAARRFPLSTLRAGGMRVINFGEHTELRPIIRTWGIGLPGLTSGWFRLRDGTKAFCIITGRERVTVLRSDDGLCILLSLADPARLRDALGA